CKMRKSKVDAEEAPVRRLTGLTAFCAVALVLSLHSSADSTWTGTFSDSMCGASHAAMRAHGEKITDRECTVACVSYQTADAPKYVFVSGGKVYPITNQRFPGIGRRAGEVVQLTGELGGDGAITITKIEAVKKG